MTSSNVKIVKNSNILGFRCKKIGRPLSWIILKIIKNVRFTLRLSYYTNNHRFKQFGSAKIAFEKRSTCVVPGKNGLSQNVHSVALQYEHLQNLTLADSSPDGNKRILVDVNYYYSCIGSEIKRGSENQPLDISSILGWILSGCNETQRNVHTNLNSTHVLRLNTENVINRSCFDKEPFELYFNKVLHVK